MILPNWHPIFVHFTVAMLTVAAIFHVLAVFMKPSNLRDEFTVLARWNLWLGASVSVVTVIFGFWAFNTVEHDDPSHAAMKVHRNWALATLTVFLLLGAWSAWRHRAGRAVKPLFVMLLLVGSGVMGFTAWHGGELVYRYGIGVMALPKINEHRHDEHAHDERQNPTMTMSPGCSATIAEPPARTEDGHAHDEHEHDH